MESAHLLLNQAVQIPADHERVIIEPVAPDYDLKELLAGITPENRHSEADFGAPQGQKPFGGCAICSRRGG
jgi:antitoxin MazE